MGARSPDASSLPKYSGEAPQALGQRPCDFSQKNRAPYKEYDFSAKNQRSP
jgi:hypothetical protein